MGKIRSSEIVGIDLGTTNSSIAFIDDTGRPKVIPNLEGAFLTPSVVYVSEKGEVIVGQTALNMLFLEPQRVFKEFKRDVGTDKIYFTHGNIRITPAWCQAEVLKYLRQCVIKFSGDDRAGTKAVIGVPANFQENQRQSVIHSAEMAGIQVLALQNEPTLAGQAYGINEKQGDRLVTVMDFGGGTFDVSLLQYTGNRVDVIASIGERCLGGKDVDNTIISMLAEKFKTEHGIELTPEGSPEDFFNVWDQVVKAKHMLSTKHEVKLITRAQGKQVTMDISREQLNQQIHPLMEKIKSLTMQMLKDAKVNMGDVQDVLLVGGSSRLTAFQDTVKEIFGKDKIIGGNVSPDLAICEGASIRAATLVTQSGDNLVDEKLQAIPVQLIESTDVMPHSLGVLVQDRVSSTRICSVILQRNTVVPCKTSKMYGSIEHDQDRFHIAVVQGEEGKSAKDCLVVGERILTLPPRSPDKESIEVIMSYDESGMVNVKVDDRISGKSEDITINFYAKK